jgi:hypothetical protein
MLCLLFIEREKKDRERERSHWEAFYPEQTHPAGCAMLGFSQQLGAVKSCLRVSPCILHTPNVMAVIILARSNHNYLSIATISQGGFWSHTAQEF